MNDIVLEVANTQIEDDLISLGKKCDVDLYHLPFSKFTIKIYEDEKCKKSMLNYLADTRLNKILNEDKKIDAFQKIALKNEIIENLKIELKKVNTNFGIRLIDVEIKDNIIFIDYNQLFKAKISFNKMVFNSESRDLEMLAEMSTEHDDATEKQMQILGSNTIAFIFGLFAFMSVTKTKIKPTSKKINNIKKKTTKNKKNNKKNNKKYIYNYRIDSNFLDTNEVINSNSNSNNKKDSKREYHLDSWYRRGHWRTYKSGKRVWIEQQFVHAHNINKNNKDDNIYRITRLNN